MTIGDEKVVYQQRELTRMDDGKWRDCSKAIFDRINDDRYVASETRALIPQSAYAELAAERDLLDRLGRQMIADYSVIERKLIAAEFQLAELRGKCEALSTDISEAVEDVARSGGYINSDEAKGWSVELRTLAAADGGGK